MPFVSVTRLRVRSARYLVPFAVEALASQRQVCRSPGFVGGRFLTEPGKAFWTVTVWDDQESMRTFRGQQAHRRAMPKLRTWCDEASVVHWEQGGGQPPEAEEASRRMVVEGRTSKVDHPSPAHHEKRIVTRTVRAGPTLSPKSRS